MTDQCSICLDSPPYSECPGRQCQRLADALKAKEEAAAALERQQEELDNVMNLEAQTSHAMIRAERAEKALEEAQRDNNWLRAELAKLVQAALDDDAAKKGDA